MGEPRTPSAPDRSSKYVVSPVWRTSRPTTSGSRRKPAGARKRHSAPSSDGRIRERRDGALRPRGRVGGACGRRGVAHRVRAHRGGAHPNGRRLRTRGGPRPKRRWSMRSGSGRSRAYRATRGAWLTAVAKRKAIDGWRRAERLDARVAALAHDLEREQAEAPDVLWGPGCGRRRRAASDLHRLPPGAVEGGAGRPDAAGGRRFVERGDRPRLSRADGDRAAADRAGEEDARGGERSLRGAALARSIRRV